MANMTGVNDSGSNYKFGDKLISPSNRSSQFDLSYINTFTASQGALIPCYFSYYYPSDSFNVSLESLIRVVNPPVVPLASRQRVFFHMYTMDYSQLWYYWEAMAKKGWSGNFEAVLPTVSCKLASLKPDTQDQYELNPLLARGSLADYLGFNFSDYTYQSGDQNIDVKLPALPFLMYQRVYRDYYLNKNLNIDDSVLLPEIDQDLLIKGLSPANLTLDGSSVETDEPLNKLPFGKLRYRNYVDDYFTSALPWPMRGDVPSLSPDIVAGNNLQVGIAPGNNINDIKELRFEPLLPIFSSTAPQVGFSLGIGGGQTINPALSIEGAGVTTLAGGNNANILAPVMYASAPGEFPQPTEQIGGTPVVNLANAGLSIGITQPALKLLWTNTLISEKLARTDGTYGQFIQTFFGTSPRHWSDHKATYHGGTYQPIVFSQVLQTAPGDTGTVGTQYGQGISSSDGFIGQFNASDFGMVMILMSIMPDTYYCQGWQKEHLYQTQDDLPLPERALLGMQPITQSEIFFNPRDSQANETLFGYQNRFDELRYRQNEIHGEIANPNNLSFFPYTQARYFDTAPNLNQEFVTTEGNIRNDWLSAPDEVPYMVQVANRVNAVRPYPYHAPPSAIMM